MLQRCRKRKSRSAGFISSQAVQIRQSNIDYIRGPIKSSDWKYVSQGLHEFKFRQAALSRFDSQGFISFEEVVGVKIKKVAKKESSQCHQ